MRTGLRLAALAVGVIAMTLWFFGGPNLGWTKTTVLKEEIDPVTELTKRVWEKRFVPGVDFLGAALLGSTALVGSSFLVRKK